MNIKDEKGVTLITLTVTIVVLLIISGISIYSGRETIRKARIEEMKTNMLLIQAKTKEYVEEVNHRMGISEFAKDEESAKDEERKRNVRYSVYVTEASFGTFEGDKFLWDEETKCEDNQFIYVVNGNSLKKMGLEKIELIDSECYYVKIDENTVKVLEVYNSKGIKDNSGNEYHSLSGIESIRD